MRVLVTGAGGQLGRELLRTAPSTAIVSAATRADLDVGDAAAVQLAVAAFRPTTIINAAAYTAVDRAESEREQAWRSNARAPVLLAQAARACEGCRLIQLSTDYVFPGSGRRRCLPDDKTAPLGVYGESKLEGERAVLQALGPRALVLRTAWLYGAVGNNFVRTMLRLMRERGSVRVVADQIGCPTSTSSLAEAIWSFAHRADLCGVFHWSDAGVASWYDFAVAIAEDGAALGLLPAGIEVLPIASTEYPTAARRPAFSLLDSNTTVAALGLSPMHWRKRLRQVLEEIGHG